MIAAAGNPGTVRWSRAVPELASLAVFGVSVAPLAVWYWRRLGDGSDEPLGAIALVAALLALATAAGFGRRDRVRILPGRLLVGSVALALAQRLPAGGAPLALGLLAVGVLALSLEMPAGKAGVIALLVLSLPLMASLDFFAGYPLRLVAAETATAVLNLAGIPVERAGVMLADGDRLVGIDPPCAGIRMLWTACFVAAVVSARMRLSWLRTLGLLAVAVGLVVVGNALRATLVFFPESGRADWPDWAHPGLGLLVHGGVLVGVFAAGNRLGDIDARHTSARWWAGMRRGASVALLAIPVLALALVAGLAGGLTREAPEDAWPAMREGVPLRRMPLSDAERSFARAFPGGIAKFAWGDAELIMRRTGRATRMMHPSGHCLRAAGFEMTSKPVYRDAEGRLWGTSVAQLDGRRWTVHERYTGEAGGVWTDASAWYWGALLDPASGPWTAVTVIRPADDGW